MKVKRDCNFLKKIRILNLSSKGRLVTQLKQKLTARHDDGSPRECFLFLTQLKITHPLFRSRRCPSDQTLSFTP